MPSLSAKSQEKKIPASSVVITSFLVDFLDIVSSLAVALLTGSVVMFSQVLEGVSDLVSSGLLLVGLARSQQKPDRKHPFGFGREIYFWSLLSGIVMLGITATLSIYFGWQRFSSPKHIDNIALAFFILIVTTFTNGYAFYLSFKRLVKNQSKWKVINIFLRSSLIETKTTFILDLMGVGASIIGVIALVIYQVSGDYRLDGLGAILIGCMLAIFAYILLIGVLDLIVGRSASRETENKIREITLSIPHVERVMELKTLNIGSEKIMVNLEVHLEHGLTTVQIEELIEEIKKGIKKEIPEVEHVQVEIEKLSKK